MCGIQKKSDNIAVGGKVASKEAKFLSYPPASISPLNDPPIINGVGAGR